MKQNPLYICQIYFFLFSYLTSKRLIFKIHLRFIKCFLIYTQTNESSLRSYFCRARLDAKIIPTKKKKKKKKRIFCLKLIIRQVIVVEHISEKNVSPKNFIPSRLHKFSDSCNVCRSQPLGIGSSKWSAWGRKPLTNPSISNLDYHLFSRD